MGKVKKIFLKIKDNVLKTLSANVINKMIGMATTMILTRILTPVDYGIWVYVLNIYSYLLLATGLGLAAGALQFGTENRGIGKAYSYYRYCTRTGMRINFILILLAGIVALQVSLPVAGSKLHLVSIFPVILLEYIVAMGQNILRSQNRIKEYANSLNVNSMAVAIGTCGGASLGVIGVIIGKYISNVISIVYEYRLLVADLQKTKRAGALEKKEIKQLWHYSLFTGASAAMNSVVYYLDVTLIAELVEDTTSIGIYRVGTLIPNALQFIPSSIIISTLPLIIYHREDSLWIKKNTNKLYFLLTLLNAIICLIIVAGAPYIIRIVSGQRYLGAVPVLRVLVFGYFFSGTFRALSVNLLAAFRRVHYGLFISVISCITDIIFNYCFIHRYGMIGAAYATLMVDIITAIISFIYVQVLIRKEKMNMFV